MFHFCILTWTDLPIKICIQKAPKFGIADLQHCIVIFRQKVQCMLYALLVISLLVISITEVATNKQNVTEPYDLHRNISMFTHKITHKCCKAEIILKHNVCLKDYSTMTQHDNWLSKKVIDTFGI